MPWLLETRTGGGRARGRRTGRTRTTHGQLAAIAFSEDGALLGRAAAWRSSSASAPALVRAKGFVSLAGEPRRGFLERAGARTELRFGEPWGDDPPATELVLIGEGLDADALRRQIWACRAR